MSWRHLQNHNTKDRGFVYDYTIKPCRFKSTERTKATIKIELCFRSFRQVYYKVTVVILRKAGFDKR